VTFAGSTEYIIKKGTETWNLMENEKYKKVSIARKISHK
jgi:hypothetical protein